MARDPLAGLSPEEKLRRLRDLKEALQKEATEQQKKQEERVREIEELLERVHEEQEVLHTQEPYPSSQAATFLDDEEEDTDEEVALETRVGENEDRSDTEVERRRRRAAEQAESAYKTNERDGQDTSRSYTASPDVSAYTTERTTELYRREEPGRAYERGLAGQTEESYHARAPDGTLSKEERERKEREYRPLQHGDILRNDEDRGYQS